MSASKRASTKICTSTASSWGPNAHDARRLARAGWRQGLSCSHLPAQLPRARKSSPITLAIRKNVASCAEGNRIWKAPRHPGRPRDTGIVAGKGRRLGKSPRRSQARQGQHRVAARRGAAHAEPHQRCHPVRNPPRRLCGAAAGPAHAAAAHRFRRPGLGHHRPADQCEIRGHVAAQRFHPPGGRKSGRHVDPPHARTQPADLDIAALAWAALLPLQGGLPDRCRRVGERGARARWISKVLPASPPSPPKRNSRPSAASAPGRRAM